MSEALRARPTAATSDGRSSSAEGGDEEAEGGGRCVRLRIASVTPLL